MLIRRATQLSCEQSVVRPVQQNNTAGTVLAYSQAADNAHKLVPSVILKCFIVLCQNFLWPFSRLQRHVMHNHFRNLLSTLVAILITN